MNSVGVMVVDCDGDSILVVGLVISERYSKKTARLMCTMVKDRLLRGGLARLKVVGSMILRMDILKVKRCCMSLVAW